MSSRGHTQSSSRRAEFPPGGTEMSLGLSKVSIGVERTGAEG